MIESAHPHDELERLVAEAERVALAMDGVGLARVAAAMEAWADRVRREPVDSASMVRLRPILEEFARRCGFVATTLHGCLHEGLGDDAAGGYRPGCSAPGPAARLVARYG